MTKQKKIFWICIFVVVALLISYGVAMIIAAIHRGEDNDNFGEVPARELSYKNEDINLKDFRCFVYNLENNDKVEKTFKGEKAVEFYNFVELGSWTSYNKGAESDVPQAESGICLVFCLKDETKAENCYGCFYLFDNDTAVYSQYSGDSEVTTHKLPSGKYQAVTDFIVDN